MRKNGRVSCLRSSVCQTVRITIRASCPAVSNSVWRLHEHLRPTRKSCCATRRQAHSTRRQRGRSSHCSRRSTRRSASPSSLSRMRWQSSRKSARELRSLIPAVLPRSARWTRCSPDRNPQWPSSLSIRTANAILLRPASGTAALYSTAIRRSSRWYPTWCSSARRRSILCSRTPRTSMARLTVR